MGTNTIESRLQICMTHVREQDTKKGTCESLGKDKVLETKMFTTPSPI